MFDPGTINTSDSRFANKQAFVFWTSIIDQLKKRLQSSCTWIVFQNSQIIKKCMTHLKIRLMELYMPGEQM